MTTTTTISQELFDETILENEECFDLTPFEALRETIDQFCQQLGHTSHNKSLPAAMAHLTLTHPATPAGQVERSNRSEFQGWLSLLDDSVASDGVVALPDDNDDTMILDALSGLAAKFKAHNNLNQHHDNDDNNEGGSSLSLPYLILFQQSCSIYTLLSFLTTILQQPAETATKTIAYQQQQQQLKLLHQVTTTLTAILSFNSKENSKCVMVRGELRDVFIVGLTRLVGLLFRFVALVNCCGEEVRDQVVDDGAEGSEKDNGEANTTMLVKTLQQTVLLDLLKLSISAVRGCEAGKVAFVQSTLEEDVVVSSSLSMCQTKRGGVQVIWTILANVSTPLNNSSSSSNDNNKLYNMEVMEASCQLLTTLCRYDDFRTPSTSNGAGAAAAAAGVQTSSAHDHAMEFHRVGVERLLIKVAKDVLNDLFEDNSCCGEEEEEGYFLAKKESLAVSVFSALRVLAVNDEIIQTMVALGVLPIVTNALQLGVTNKGSDTTANNESENDGESSNSSSTRSSLLRKHRLVAASLGLIRNLCGNDEIKTNLCLGSSDQSNSSSSSSISSTPSALPHLLRAMQLNPTIAPIQEHACGTLAAMALRRPSNARAIIDEGGPRLIITAMKRHEQVVSVQRQGALAVRNIVSRLLKELDGGSGDNSGSSTAVEEARAAIRDRFGELGVEDVLRNIAGRHQGSVDEAYAALRDLGYSVSLTKFSAEDLQEGNMKNSSKPMMFGGKHNSNFRPVYEQSAGLNNAVDEAVSNFGA